MNILSKILHFGWEPIDWSELPKWLKCQLPQGNGEKRTYRGHHYEYIIINHTTRGSGNGHMMALTGYEAYRKERT